jgi:hypothetical protein
VSLEGAAATVEKVVEEGVQNPRKNRSGRRRRTRPKRRRIEYPFVGFTAGADSPDKEYLSYRFLAALYVSSID